MRPKKGEFYRHKKGDIYQILGYSKHTETKEILILYKSFKDNITWARPLENFMEDGRFVREEIKISRRTNQ